MSKQMEQMTNQLGNWLAIMATHFENLILSSDSGCDYPYKSCLSTFDPAIPALYFNFIQLFLYLFPMFFFIALSVIHQCHPYYSTLNGPV